MSSKRAKVSASYSKASAAGIKHASSNSTDTIVAVDKSEAKSLVDTWMKESTTVANDSRNASQDDDGTTDTHAPLRPSRLGLGAQAVQIKPTLPHHQDPLGKKIFGSSRKNAQESRTKIHDNDGEDDENIDDSKVLSVGKSKPLVKFASTQSATDAKHKAKKRLSQSIQENKDDKLEAAESLEFEDFKESDFVSNWSDSEEKSNDTNSKSPSSLTQSLSAGAPQSDFDVQKVDISHFMLPKDFSILSKFSGKSKVNPRSLKQDNIPHRVNQSEDAAIAKSKRKKIRSKQKNIRKDTRPAELKPNYLTPGDSDYVEKKKFYVRKPIRGE